jgi:hypothetical protein
MVWSSVFAFAVVALIFGLGDVVAAKTKGVMSSVLTAILIFLIFGGALKLLPQDLMNLSGLMQLIPTFGMALILVNVGSLLDINDLRSEWRTVLISLLSVIGVVVVAFTAGTAIFGREFSLIATAPTAGGMAATMMLTEAANQAERPDLAAVAAAVMALQILVGLPIASFCLRKEAKRFLGASVQEGTTERKRINFRLLPNTPKILDTPAIHLARIAIIGLLAQLCTKLTGISTGVTYLVFGLVFSAIGFVEKGSLRTAGGEGILMLATYASVTASFVSMTFAQFGKILVPVIGFLLISAVAVCIVATLVGKIFKWSPWLAIPIGLACMFGYPVTYAVAMEVSAGAAKGRDDAEEVEAKLVKYLLPKMLIAGVVSVSIASVVIAGMIIPILF